MDNTEIEPTRHASGGHGERDLDLVALKALAHPLRVEIFGVLSTYGPFTASGLAERLGESSGATSYHLRQLAKHGIIVEVEGKGSARERWWRMAPGGVTIGSPPEPGGAGGAGGAPNTSPARGAK